MVTVIVCRAADPFEDIGVNPLLVSTHIVSYSSGNLVNSCEGVVPWIGSTAGHLSHFLNINFLILFFERIMQTDVFSSTITSRLLFASFFVAYVLNILFLKVKTERDV